MPTRAPVAGPNPTKRDDDTEPECHTDRCPDANRGARTDREPGSERTPHIDRDPNDERDGPERDLHCEPDGHSGTKRGREPAIQPGGGRAA